MKYHFSKILSARVVYVQVRNFVREKRSKIERVTATGVFHFSLIPMKLLTVLTFALCRVGL